MPNCTYCLKEFSTKKMANHVGWCEMNPASLKRRKRAYAPRCTSNSKQRAGISAAWKRGCYDKVDHSLHCGWHHTEETKKRMSIGSSASTHRRLMRHTVLYNGVLLDSSWELALAKRLDELKIQWTRPKPLPWADSQGKLHHYFPDFYLPDSNVYLDPKNPAAIESQKEKLGIILKLYPNIRIIETLIECQNFRA